jgi:hypothetical protein
MPAMVGHQILHSKATPKRRSSRSAAANALRRIGKPLGAPRSLTTVELAAVPPTLVGTADPGAFRPTATAACADPVAQSTASSGSDAEPRAGAAPSAGAEVRRLGQGGPRVLLRAMRSTRDPARSLGENHAPATSTRPPHARGETVAYVRGMRAPAAGSARRLGLVRSRHHIAVRPCSRSCGESGRPGSCCPRESGAAAGWALVTSR